MKRIGILLLVSLVLLSALPRRSARVRDVPLIGVSKFLAHPALDAVEAACRIT
jgi:ABC-type uncharacterized transport system substrate-binding protein